MVRRKVIGAGRWRLANVWLAFVGRDPGSVTVLYLAKARDLFINTNSELAGSTLILFLRFLPVMSVGLLRRVHPVALENQA